MEEQPKSCDWSNYCSNILNPYRCQDEKNCQCYVDYLMWTKDNPKIDFDVWKTLIQIEYKQYFLGDC